MRPSLKQLITNHILGATRPSVRTGIDVRHLIKQHSRESTGQVLFQILLLIVMMALAFFLADEGMQWREEQYRQQQLNQLF